MNSKYYKNVLKKRIGYLVLLVCVIAIGAILSSVSPYIFGKTIDTISIKNQSDFHIWITGYIVVLLMIQLFLTVETLIGQWVTITIENDIKKSLMESILYIKNRYLEQLQVQGKLTEKDKISRRRQKIKDLLAEGLSQKEIYTSLKISKRTCIYDIKFLKEQGEI